MQITSDENGFAQIKKLRATITQMRPTLINLLNYCKSSSTLDVSEGCIL